MTVATLTTKRPHVAGPSEPMPRRHARVARAATGAIYLVLAAYVLFPVFWLLVSAGKPTSQLITGDNFQASGFQYLTNLRDLFAFDDGIYGRWLLNTLAYAGLGSVVSVLISAMAGFALAKYRFRGRSTVAGSILAGVMIPTTALVLPIFLLLAEVGLTNNFWGVFAVSLVHPFGVYLCMAFADASVPDEVLEAARIDGASEARIVFRIGLPMMRDGLLTVVLLQFVAIWNNYFLPLVLLSDQTLFPVTVGITNWNLLSRQVPDQYRLVLIGALVATIPLMVGFVAMQRFWRAGLTTGSIK
ncbi:carbohydrate ABC transporter permease [Actinotalea sp. M2MS4P-6]|uniref:carbohydrate ABC transporter permease n=1 Tax=Actinotalea sp. M2MS4P-6 TaxID=2983762 RepID=UPI0021E40865|nr:carbohydrate ABC transporter permease [Actinotalea sp. M2MS4P-6]MCV2394750.1 carbohydrate ABC transporter permease [Actinotalea sp. M2MS4P-6]